MTPKLSIEKWNYSVSCIRRSTQWIYESRGDYHLCQHIVSHTNQIEMKIQLNCFVHFPWMLLISAETECTGGNVTVRTKIPSKLVLHIFFYGFVSYSGGLQIITIIIIYSWVQNAAVGWVRGRWRFYASFSSLFLQSNYIGLVSKCVIDSNQNENKHQPNQDHSYFTTVAYSDFFVILSIVVRFI